MTKEERSKNRLELLRTRRELRQHKTENPTPKGIKGAKLFNVFSLVLGFFLVAMLLRTLVNADFVFSSEEIFESFANINVFPVDIVSQGVIDFTITADWGNLNFLRDFINVFAELLGFLQFISIMLFNALQYVVQLLRILFGF